MPHNWILEAGCVGQDCRLSRIILPVGPSVANKLAEKPFEGVKRSKDTTVAYYGKVCCSSAVIINHEVRGTRNRFRWVEWQHLGSRDNGRSTRSAVDPVLCPPLSVRLGASEEGHNRPETTFVNQLLCLWPVLGPRCWVLADQLSNGESGSKYPVDELNGRGGVLDALR